MLQGVVERTSIAGSQFTPVSGFSL